MGKSLEHALYKRIYLSGQKAHEMMLNINHNEIRLYTTRRTKIAKTDNLKCWQGSGVNGTLLLCWWEFKVVQIL